MAGGSHNYQKTELIALSEDGPVPGCLSNLKDHPNKVYLAAGGALSDRGEKKVIQGVPACLRPGLGQLRFGGSIHLAQLLCPSYITLGQN